jgi:membrane protein implicated in regulation of membrane protease activity
MIEAEADMLGERVATEKENRKLRFGIAIAIAALILMALQVFAANGIFAWYGVAAGWAVPSSAVTAWMGTTVIEVVSVVLVVVNYLFPGERRKYA